MQDFEDLGLDLKELLFLLKEAKERKELVPVAVRHINRLMHTLQEVKDEFLSPEEVTHSIKPQPTIDLSKGLTLNDTFRFSRELFNGDKDEMNRVLQEISRMSSLADVLSYLSTQFEWDEENDAVNDFTEFLKNYFV